VSNVPASTRTLVVLRALAAAPGPLTAAGLARDLDLPRSSVYHLLSAMAAEGFVVHYPEDERWGLGVAAFEIGTAYLRQEPLERLPDLFSPGSLSGVARRPPALHTLACCTVAKLCTSHSTNPRQVRSPSSPMWGFVYPRR